jgi:ERCC4-related helicase
MALPKIVDNQRRMFIDVFDEVAVSHDEISIATGYWDIEAMRLTLPKLRKFKRVRLLIGREPLIPRHNIQMPEPDYPDQDFKFDLSHVKEESDLRPVVTEIKELIADGKLEVRVYRKEFLHAKCYIFGSYDSDQAVGIIGSSNFTKNGLTQNLELNAVESDHRVVTFQPKTEKQEVGHLFWFDALWNDPTTEPWNEQFGKLLETSPIGDVLYGPYETYIKTLYDLYRDELDDDKATPVTGEARSLFDFQAKNANSLRRKLEKYGVAMLADSVGLGKTLTAISVIKQYLDGKDGKRRVEVICPKSLVKQWEQELTTEKIYGLKPITLQNTGEIQGRMDLDAIASVSLFVIDESHNLRQSSGVRFQQVLDWIRKNPKGHVLLLTATPINNQLTDLTNQILLGAGGQADIFKLTVSDEKKHTVRITFHQAVENLKKKINKDITLTGKIDYGYIKRVMTPIIRAFVVRRTRQGIEREYGALTVNGVEKKFPKVLPEVTEYQLDASIVPHFRSMQASNFSLGDVFATPPDAIVEKCRDLKHPLDQLANVAVRLTEQQVAEESPMYFVFQLILMLGFMPYRWMMYKPQFYGKTREQIREIGLGSAESKTLLLQIGMFGILRTVFLKRMESSVKALLFSLDNYEKRLDVFGRGVESGKIVSLKDIKDMQSFVDSIDDEDLEGEERAFDSVAIEDISATNFEIDAIKADIRKEHEVIGLIRAQLMVLEADDAKLKCFAKLISDLRAQKPGAKVLVFSYFADTVNYLKSQLPLKLDFLNDGNIGFVSSKTKGEAETTAGRFSPRSKKYVLKEGETEIQYLVSTDVLSEGQNLQDAGILVNYDLHWNPVRMIQRNGRVNRLGSDFEEVQIFNLRPEAKLDSYLKLIQRLEGKIDMIRNTIGTDTPVLDEPENPVEFTDSVSSIYSPDLRERMRALDEAAEAADFLLAEDTYVLDLKDFHRNPSLDAGYKEEIYGISGGKWGVMPPHAARGEARPEILGLLRLVGEDGGLIGHQFAISDVSGGRLAAVDQLQSLEWLRTGPDAVVRQADNISADKSKVRKLMEENIIQYYGNVEEATLVGQQNDILRLLFKNGYDEEVINKVRDSFKAADVFFIRDFDSMKRKVMKDVNAGRPYQEGLQELVKLAERYHATRIDETPAAPSRAESVLIYAQHNR